MTRLVTQSRAGRSPNDAGESAIPRKLVNSDERLVAASPQFPPQRERLPSDRRGAISGLNPKSGLIVVRAP
jgi:hypothetical protein